MERKLATLQRIESLSPIPGADRIELLKMEGLAWQCVVQKGFHDVGGRVVFFEIDSFLPASAPQFDFLERDFREYEGKMGARVRTIRLRGQLSQGIAIQASEFPQLDEVGHAGACVTEVLGVVKWERPIPAELAGKMRGGFPSIFPKTDEERVQNLWPKLLERREEMPGEIFMVTEKLEGASMTAYVDLDGYFGVCSRNIDLLETGENTLWKMARVLDLERKLRDFMAANSYKAVALQGELIGPNVQGNHYRIREHRLAVFGVYVFDLARYVGPDAARLLAADTGLTHVPVIAAASLSDFASADDVLRMADGPSAVNNAVPREGLVFRSTGDPRFSFKAVSNAYLLGEK